MEGATRHLERASKVFFESGLGEENNPWVLAGAPHILFGLHHPSS